MSPEQYQQMARELGIERGALESGKTFPVDAYSVVSVYRAGDPALIARGGSMRVRPPLPDLSHLNPLKRGSAWLTPERKKDWIAKRKQTLAEKARTRA